MTCYHHTWAAIAASLFFSDLPRTFAVTGCPVERTWTSTDDFRLERRDATGWTEADNIGLSNGVAASEMASYYDAKLLHWEVIVDNDADGVGDEFSRSLAAVRDSRHLATFLFGMSFSDMAGGLDTHTGEWYTARTQIGGWFHTPRDAGHKVMATITLNVASVPGTYTVSVIKGQSIRPNNVPLDIPPGAALTITVP